MNLPITVKLSVDTSKTEYGLCVESNGHSIDLLNSTAINAVIGVPVYEGDYNVTPLARSEVLLGTKDKKCTDDITVLKIPRFSTSNEYGTTFYIAEN